MILSHHKSHKPRPERRDTPPPPPSAPPDGLVDRTLEAVDRTQTTGHVLLAEDDEEFRALVEHALRCAGYRVTACTDGVELADHIGSYVLSEVTDDFDLIISDIRMPGISGMQVLKGMSRWAGFPPMILMTAFGDDRAHATAEELGAAAMLDKPFELDDLLEIARKILAQGHRPMNESRG
jgi:DNA-binding response OmpR family regulator